MQKPNKEGCLELNQINTANQNPPLFSLVESDDHYMVAIDLPSLPASFSEIFLAKDELFVEGIVNGEKQKIFSCLPVGKGIKAAYQNGALWLTLPKADAEKRVPKLKIV